jgi:hypothetical protein
VTACVEGIGEGGIAGGVTAGHITDLQWFETIETNQSCCSCLLGAETVCVWTIHSTKNGKSFHQPKIDSGTFMLSQCICGCSVILTVIQSSLQPSDIAEKVT